MLRRLRSPSPYVGRGKGWGGLVWDVARSAPRLRSSSRSRGVNPRDRVSGDAPLRAPNGEYRCLYRSGLRTPPPPTWGGDRGGGSLVRDVARSAPRLKSSSRSRGVNPRDRVSGDAPLRAPYGEYRCLYRSGLRTPPPPTWGGDRGGG